MNQADLKHVWTLKRAGIWRAVRAIGHFLYAGYVTKARTCPRIVLED